MDKVKEEETVICTTLYFQGMVQTNCWQFLNYLQIISQYVY